MRLLFLQIGSRVFSFYQVCVLYAMVIVYFNFYLGSFGLYLGTKFPVGFIPENYFLYMLYAMLYAMVIV